MKAVLIDDEAHSLETTELLLAHYCPDVMIVGKTEDADEGIKLINELRPNLVFLDVSMPKMTGFELLKNLTHRTFELVFTTAHDQYAVRAFQVGAVHYLLKPIDGEELRNAVQRVREKQAILKLDVTSILQQVTAHRQPKIAVPSVKGLEMVEIDNIIRCEADSNYSTIYLISGKIVVTKTLKELDQILASYNFVRVHHSHLINLAHLKTYLKGEGGTVILSNGEHINVSRSRKMAFMQKLESL
jgi:two-component system, LytTR family, response regulator